VEHLAVERLLGWSGFTLAGVIAVACPLSSKGTTCTRRAQQSRFSSNSFLCRSTDTECFRKIAMISACCSGTRGISTFEVPSQATHVHPCYRITATIPTCAGKLDSIAALKQPAVRGAAAALARTDSFSAVHSWLQRVCKKVSAEPYPLMVALRFCSGEFFPGAAPPPLEGRVLRPSSVRAHSLERQQCRPWTSTKGAHALQCGGWAVQFVGSETP
jgi:hypothetical protein